MQEHGIFLHAHHPKSTWLALGVAGISILLFADKLSYVGYVGLIISPQARLGTGLAQDLGFLGANVLVWGFIVLFLAFTYIHLPARWQRFLQHDAARAHVFAILIALGLYRLLQDPLSKLSHRFLRMPLRTGLFPNFDRIKFLRERIPDDKLRNSAIRVIMTATDIQRGAARFFSNATVEALVDDPARRKILSAAKWKSPQDLVLAAVASSAYTFAYEAVHHGWPPVDRWRHHDQPAGAARAASGRRRAFPGLIAPLEGAETRPKPIKTFLDVGVHAVDILIPKTSNRILPCSATSIALCTVYAARWASSPSNWSWRSDASNIAL